MPSVESVRKGDTCVFGRRRDGNSGEQFEVEVWEVGKSGDEMEPPSIGIEKIRLDDFETSVGVEAKP